MASDTNFAFEFEKRSVSFDADAFDDALRNHGVKYVHWRAMRCPVGLTDRYSERRVHEDHAGCSNGNIYTKAGIVTGVFVGNDSKWNASDPGLRDGSTSQATVPRTYDDPEGVEVQVAPYDRFYLLNESILVPHSQFVEASATGRDKLTFPAVSVDDLIDASGRRYGGDDFEISPEGQIVWKRGAPGLDAALGKGVIYSIRYNYRPFYVVDRLVHQIRVAQVETALERTAIRMPQSFILQRENVAEREDSDDQAPNPNSQAQATGPRQTVFGPR